MSWQPPTEDEFNDDWITPLDALDVSDVRMADHHDQWAILEQLRAGQIIAVARTAQTSQADGLVRPLMRVPAAAWSRMRQFEDDRFWATGHLVVTAGATDNYGGAINAKDRFFNIRFDPGSFSGRPPPALPHDDEGKPASPTTDRDKEISTDEATCFSRAVLAGWPDATEAFAHAKALAFFPENKVPREWFLSIFRSIRGPKNRGKSPKKRP